MNERKAKKYLKLPKYLTNDLEVIKSVCEADNSLINSIPLEKILLVVKDTLLLEMQKQDVSSLTKEQNMS